MRGRAGVLICLGVVALASLWTYEPRLHHTFPSLVDDWSAIQKAPEQLHTALRLGSPEDGRYRPGFVIWNALQWHTIGAPTDFLGPQLWGAARWAVLVIGVTLLALLLVGQPTRARDGRWLLAIGVPLVAVTAPSIAIDIARYGPKSRCSWGACPSAPSSSCGPSTGSSTAAASGPGVVAAVGGGVVLWAFGVLQKEPSICVLLLAPFLWPTIRQQGALGAARRPSAAAASGQSRPGILLPFVPMVVRTVQLASHRRPELTATSAGKSMPMRLSDQLSQAGGCSTPSCRR